MNKETKEAVDRFLRHGNKRGGDFSKQTIGRYRMDLNDFFWFVKKDFRQVSKKDCEDYEDFLKNKKKWERKEAKSDKDEKLDVKSVYHKITSVKSFYRWIMKNTDYGLSKNPMDVITIPSEKMKTDQCFIEQQILSREEIKKLLEVTTNQRDHLILVLLYNTGMRVSELTGLNIDSINMEKRTIVIKNAKGGKSRVIGFNDDVYEDLKLWLLIRPHKDSEALITGKFGKRLDSSFIRDMIKKQCKEAGINKPITPHSFRHMFITNCIEDGVLLPELAAYVGHADIGMTTAYIAIAKLGNSMSKFKGIHKMEE